MNLTRLTVGAMQQRSYETAKEKGWWEDVEQGDPRVIPEKLMLIVTEVSEAMEDYREGKLRAYAEESGKPCGFESELADIVIRVGDLCGHLGIDLEQAVSAKLEYNDTRSYRHGGKRA